MFNNKKRVPITVWCRGGGRGNRFLSFYFIVEFLSLSIGDILGHLGTAVHPRMFRGIPGLDPLDARNTSPPSGDKQKCLQALPSLPSFSLPPSPLLRTTVLKRKLLAGSRCKVCARLLFTSELKHWVSSECRTENKGLEKITYP